MIIQTLFNKYQTFGFRVNMLVKFYFSVPILCLNVPQMTWHAKAIHQMKTKAVKQTNVSTLVMTFLLADNNTFLHVVKFKMV